MSSVEERLRRKWAVMADPKSTEEEIRRASELVRLPSWSESEFRAANQMSYDEYERMIF